ncbi:MAG: hypothetical protein IJT73_10025 [Selenomonadaceae bacterium]|nr:hypothetical protein [Selenomonadaceae bacterium]
MFGIKFALLGRIAFENPQIQKIETAITKKDSQKSREYDNIADTRAKKSAEESKFFLFRSSGKINRLADDIDNSNNKINGNVCCSAYS